MVPALCEAGCIISAYLLAAFFSHSPESSFARELLVRSPWVVVLLVVWHLQAIDQRLYVSRRSDALVPQLLDVSKAIVTALLIAFFLVALFKTGGINREFAVLFCGAALVSIVVLRLVARLSLWGLRWRGFNHRRIVIVGANPRTTALVQTILSHEHYGFHIDGFLEDDASRQHYLHQHDIPYLGRIEALEHYLVEHVVDVVYVTLPLRTHYETIQNIAHLCEGVGVSVRLVGDLFELRTTTCEVMWLDTIPLLSLSAPSLESRFDLRRFSEIVESSVLLLILAPVFLLLALWIKWDSPGPVFARELRVHPRTRRPYRLLRFRTRAVAAKDSRRDIAKVPAVAEEKPPLTRAGKFLRQYSLEELPQLINVWLGQMQPTTPPPALDQSELRGEISAATSAPSPQVSETSLSESAATTVREPARRLDFAILVLAVLDAGGILCAFLAAVYESLPWNMTFLQGILRHLPYLSICVLLWYAAAVDQRLFGRWRTEKLPAYVFAITKAVGSALVYCTVVMALLSRAGIDRHFLLAFSLATPAAVLVLRLVFHAGVFCLQRGGLLRRRTLLVGANERAAHLARVFTSERSREYRLEGFIEDDRDRARPLEEQGVECLGSTENLPAVIAARRADEVYVCLPMRSSYETVQRIVRLCERQRVSLNLVADLFPLRVASRRLTYLEDMPVISLSTIPEAQVRLAFKRLVDLAVSSALLLMLAPVFFIVAILIKRESEGPVFFAQERVGQNQRRFRMLKFRTMVANAEALRKDLEALNEADGPVFKIRNDPRITRVGRFLRKYSIDEFPQLINVWLGQMSLVGPRPPIASEVEKYTWGQRRRLSVRPGMTGLWQVSGRSDIGFEQWVELDLTYIDTWSLGLDFLILFRTFRAVVQGRGAA